MSETLYIIDGHSQIFRAFHALRPGSMSSPAGEPTWATHVFTNMLLNFLADKRPTYLAMAIDGPRSELKRTEWYPEYKAHRPPPPEGFKEQEERIFQIVETLGVPMLHEKGFEADDMMATLVAKFASPELNVVLISRDKDLDQLVGPHCVLYDPMKNETFDAAAILEKKGYPPEKAVEVQTLMGDSTDNIPGIQGVGPKTAVKLVNQYGSAEAVVEHADEQTPKLRERLLAGAESLEISRRLVTLDRHVPLSLTLDNLRCDSLNYAGLKPIFDELKFDRMTQLLAKLVDGELPESSALAGETTADDFDYQLIDTPDALASLAEELKGVTRLAVDTETTNTRPMWASLVGVSLAWTPGRAYYLPVAGPLMDKKLELAAVQATLGPILSSKTVEKIGHNFKYDRIVLENAGFTIDGPVFDTMIAAHLIDAGRLTYKMDALSEDLLGHRCIPITDIIGKGKKQITMDQVPTELAAVYAAEDADITLRLADVLSPQLDECDQRSLFANLEMPLLDVLAEMERAGILVDPAVLNRLQVDMSKQADELRERIVAAAGKPFNVDSPKQLAVVLFEGLGLPILKKTKTGPSTNESVLQELAAEHGATICEDVLAYRKLTKLISTYLVGLKDCIHPNTHRVHTSYHQASVATGRLSSSDPNLQNIPVRTQQGRQIRSAFIAPDGHLLLSADYSQVELRMLAHFCRDETLLAAFADDLDIHKAVAAEVFHVPLDDVTPDMRARAKTVNFGIVYGQTAFGLANTLRIPRHEAQEFIDRYKARFPKIDEFLSECVEQAREKGYVETIFGRRRPITDIDAKNPMARNQAERLAINTVVQGSAADLIKQAMLAIDAKIWNEDRPAKMLLQIHDELLFEIPEAAVNDEQAMIVQEMTGAIELTVPLKVDVGVGPNWLDAK